MIRRASGPAVNENRRAVGQQCRKRPAVRCLAYGSHLLAASLFEFDGIEAGAEELLCVSVPPIIRLVALEATRSWEATEAMETTTSTCEPVLTLLMAESATT